VLTALAAALLVALAPGQPATVRVPVANVWAAPGAGHLPLDPHVLSTGDVSLSQRLALVGHMPTEVLYGERVLVLAVRPGWTKIAVPDQPSPLDRRGYPGWVLSWQLGPLFAAPLVVTAGAPGWRTGRRSASAHRCRRARSRPRPRDGCRALGDHSSQTLDRPTQQLSPHMIDDRDRASSATPERMLMAN